MVILKSLRKHKSFWKILLQYQRILYVFKISKDSEHKRARHECFPLSAGTLWHQLMQGPSYTLSGFCVRYSFWLLAVSMFCAIYQAWPKCSSVLIAVPPSCCAKYR